MKKCYKKRLNEPNNEIALDWRAIAIGVSVGAGISYCLAALFKLF